MDRADLVDLTEGEVGSIIVSLVSWAETGRCWWRCCCCCLPHARMHALTRTHFYLHAQARVGEERVCVRTMEEFPGAHI